MDDTKILQIKVGITILVGVTMLVLGIVWLKGITFKPNTFEVSILFSNTAGLQVGDPVTVSGLKIGKVADIGLEKDSVVVVVSLSNTIKLKSDASAVISSTDFFGGKKVELTPGTASDQFDVHRRIPGIREPDLTELTSQMKAIALDVRGTLVKVDSVLVGLNSVVNDRSVTGSLRHAIYNLDSTITRVKSIVVKSDSKIDSLFSRLSSTTRSFRGLVDKTDVRLDTAFAGITALTAALTGVTASLDTVMHHVQSGEGNLGKMIYDDGLYVKLDRAVTEIDSLVAVMREKGMKVHLNLFGD